MKRRAFALSVAGVLGGCASTGANTSTSRPTKTVTATESPTATPTPTPTPTDTPFEINTTRERQSFLERLDAQDVYRSENDIEYSAGWSAYADYVRVYDEQKGEVVKVEPRYRVFFQISVSMENLGGESVRTPEITDFEVRTPRYAVPPIVDFPPGYDYDAMRSHPEGVQFYEPMPELADDKISPGDFVTYTLIYDIFTTDVKEIALNITAAVPSQESVYLTITD